MLFHIFAIDIPVTQLVGANVGCAIKLEQLKLSIDEGQVENDSNIMSLHHYIISGTNHFFLGSSLNRRHCITFLLGLANNESEADPNNNLMMRRAGLYISLKLLWKQE